MIHLPDVKIQEICCDGTSALLPDNPFFSYKSTFHNAYQEGRLHVDFSLHVVNKPSQILGIWRCRINFWLPKNGTIVTHDEGFEYYKTGFRLALASAEDFIDTKYSIKNILAPQSDEELLARYKERMARKS